MEVRYSSNPAHFCKMTTEEIRENFLIESLFKPDSIEMVYSEVDRAIAGSAVPAGKRLELASADELRAEYFCQRRELGVLNVGEVGAITVDGKKYKMANSDCLYIGRGSKEILFASDDSANPAQFYLLSYPAHKEYPTSHIQLKQASAVHLGSAEESNKRTIYKYIHPEGVKSCQLVMGFTILEPGCVWNTMPPHTHQRRTEIYMYFNMPEKERVFHLIGEAAETRHIVVSRGQAVISPSWSIHSGVGTSAYSFCWGMGGENQDFDDMDHLAVEDVR
jgi:4-deoxy-L-threo-5-hexosulose-uronate ketol-isomerase